MDETVLTALVEAILITSRGPLTAEDVVEAVADEDVAIETVDKVLVALQSSWES